jgi:hypothetical protein
MGAVLIARPPCRRFPAKVGVGMEVFHVKQSPERGGRPTQKHWNSGNIPVTLRKKFR